MNADGWRHETFAPKHNIKQIEPYKTGRATFAWVRATSKSISQRYLLLLSVADEKGFEIVHLANEQEYTVTVDQHFPDNTIGTKKPQPARTGGETLCPLMDVDGSGDVFGDVQGDVYLLAGFIGEEEDDVENDDDDDKEGGKEED